MKRLLTIALATASAGLIAAGSASAANPYTPSAPAATYNAGDPANGIGDSRHNLGNLGEHLTITTNTSPNGLSGTSEVCVFCHTPHHSNTDVTRVPIWNRNNSTAASYTAYGPTLGGSNVSVVGSTSLACLSCHDGVTTFDNVINTPGRGFGPFTDAVFWDKNEMVAFTMTSARLNIGTNLTNDHPVSIAYSNDGRASLRSSSTIISTIDVAAGLADSAQTWDGGNLTKNLWAVKGFIKADAIIGDLLRGSNSDMVECSSCHDPHFNNKSYNEVDSTYGSVNQEFESNGLFLRRVGGNSGSGVCRTCHNK